MTKFRTGRLGSAICVLVLLASASLDALAASQRSATVGSAGAGIASGITCEQLGKADISAAVGAGTRITRTTQAAPANGGHYCVVEGTISSEIRFEVRLPTSGWTGRYLQTGCGGLCGSLDIRVEHADNCAPVTQHQVVLASTDMGHSGPGGQWAERNPAARADFGYRGVHLTAVASRALITAYYGQPPRYSYFSGCSDGGREALIEAQRYPEDFDGIAAGAPALNFTVQNSFYHAWNALSNSDKDGNAILEAAQLPLLHAAVVQACDGLDGVRDGIIEDPRNCRFDPVALQCAAGANAPDCLTAAQVEAARKIYAGAHDAQGTKLVMAGPMPGSELSWTGVFVPAKPGAPIMSRTYASDTLRYLAYESPLPAAWSLNDFEFTEAALRSFKLRGLYDATNPDLSAFKRRGGKLLMWHGWSDPHISPINSIGYYEAVARQMGTRSVQSFARLFLIPGFYHCSGGEGPAQFDVISALMDWVENGKSPEVLQLNSERTADRPDNIARPLYPYPDKAQRVAEAPVGQTGAYRRVKGGIASRPLDWAGAHFFTSDYELKCDSGMPSQCAGQAISAQH